MKNEIKDIIVDNEEIIWSEKPNETCYVFADVIPMLPFAILWLMFDVFFISMMVTNGEGLGNMLWIIIPFFAIHLMPVWMVIGKYIKNKFEYQNVIYTITDKRVIIRDGFIGIGLKSIDYNEINNVNVSVNVLEKIKKVGTIILSVEEKPFKLIAIKEPYKIFKMLQKISFDVKTDINYPNAKRPDNNPGYNSKYEYKDK